jgi:glycosyl hydrolase family 106( putative alpha-L-rhamnosidase)
MDEESPRKALRAPLKQVSLNRRSFIIQGSILATGYHLRNTLPHYDFYDTPSDLYAIFKNPPTGDRPYVRWWWNGDKIERDELARELRLLKQAGIGGVEINPVKFPDRTNDLGKKSVQWLSPEWIDLLHFAFSEARSLEMTCDLIVGSGWPFGAEWLEGEERSQIVVIGTKKLQGPLTYETSTFDLLKEADPPISSPFPGRKMEMLSVFLAPAVINNVSEVKDVSGQISNDSLRCSIPEGKYVLYALVKIHGFMQVIQGAPGATGPVLNHYNESAVKKYLNKMSATIQEKIGSLSTHVRSLFIDSLELEGANWCDDMSAEFQKRRGYNLLPYLLFVLYRIGSMGNTWLYDYGADYGDDFKEMIRRVRYDFELTKAELLQERFIDSFLEWCRQNKVLSRMQGYGRGYFPLEGTFGADIPECETWIKPGLGTEMSDVDYRIGRAYTMINKYVSSAAHLKGKKQISCEELTNTNVVFNETLELLKVTADQSIISGTTHPIFHGFNYSPINADYPGWVIYGTFMNERNPWWPYFRKFVDYRARLSALLQQATMFADIAILPATADLWSIYGAQNEPFPAIMYPEWQTLVWESIHQNGNACDYISESVIQESKIENGILQYGPRKYQSIFLTQVDSLEPSTARKLSEFVESGGRIFFIESFPTKAPGWEDHEQRDREVRDWINKIKAHSDGAIFLNKPGKDHTSWFKATQEKYNLQPYLRIDSPNKFITQVRYQARDSEMIVLINSNMNAGYAIKITPSFLNSRMQPWLWDAETGERYKLKFENSSITLDMEPADLKLVVFDRQKKGSIYRPTEKGDKNATPITGAWSVTGRHIDGRVITADWHQLQDLKEIADWVNFCGTISYRNNFSVNDQTKIEWLNLGRVIGTSELSINGISVGVKWYGNRIHGIGSVVKKGNNEIEIKVVTTMGNYLKSLTNNKIAQYWTSEGNKIQPLQSMGLLGPVTIY